MITDQYKLYKNSKWAQLIYNLLFIHIWYWANDGLAFWDDFTYLNFANQVNEGTFLITSNHFTSRVALIYPVAQVIDLLGINSISITVFPLICTLIILNLFFYLGRTTNIWIGLIGGFMLICDYHAIVFSTHLFPEMPMALYVFIAIGAYDMVNRRVGDHRFLGLLTALAIFTAFLTKTTIFLLIPLFLYLFWNDWFGRKKNKSYWLITISALVFFVVLNGFFYYETTGDFFYRFTNISNNHEATVKTFFDKSFVDILKRLTYLPFLGFTRGGFFIPLLFVLPALFSIKKMSWRLDDQKMIWPISVLMILLAWWFMSTNWRYYSPMPLDTRHITFLIPLMLVAGVNWWTKTSIFKQALFQKWIWLPLAIFMAIPIYRMAMADQRNFEELETVFIANIVPEESKKTIFTDGLTSYGYPYFYGFEEAQSSFEWFSETEKEIQVGDMILINPAFLNDRFDDNKFLEKLMIEAETKGTLSCFSWGEVKLCELQ